MYPYHNMIKKRIKNGELVKIQELNDKTFALNFIFSTSPYIRPIRHKSVYRYEKILEEYGVKIEKSH